MIGPSAGSTLQKIEEWLRLCLPIEIRFLQLLSFHDLLLRGSTVTTTMTLEFYHDFNTLKAICERYSTTDTPAAFSKLPSSFLLSSLRRANGLRRPPVDHPRSSMPVLTAAA